MALQVRRADAGVVAAMGNMQQQQPPSNDMMRPSRRELESLLQALGGSDHRRPLAYDGDPFGSLSNLRNDCLEHYRGLCDVLGESERVDVTSGTQLSSYIPNFALPQLQAATPSGGGGGRLLLGPGGSSSTSYGYGNNGRPGGMLMAAAPGGGGGGGGGWRGGQGAAMDALAMYAGGGGGYGGGNGFAGGSSNIGAVGTTTGWGGAGGGPGFGVGGGSGWSGGLPGVQIGGYSAPRPLPANQLPSFMSDMQMGSAISMGQAGSEGQFQREESVLVFPPIGTAFDGRGRQQAAAAAGPQHRPIESLVDFNYNRPAKLQSSVEDMFEGSRARDHHEGMNTFLADYARGATTKAMQPARMYG